MYIYEIGLHGWYEFVPKKATLILYYSRTNKIKKGKNRTGPFSHVSSVLPDAIYLIHNHIINFVDFFSCVERHLFALSSPFFFFLKKRATSMRLNGVTLFIKRISPVQINKDEGVIK